MSKKLYLVETYSTFRHRFLVEAESLPVAERCVREEKVMEWQQKHLGEVISKSHVVSRRELKSAAYTEDNKTDGSPGMPFEKFIYIATDDDHSSEE